MNNLLLTSSEMLYAFLVRLYPKKYSHEFAEEMKYVFSEQLSDSYQTSGVLGIIHLWFRTVVDALKSLIKQHLENKNEGVFMKYKNILLIAAGTGLILLIPLIAMQFSNEVQWDETDFIIIGSLLFIGGLVIEFIRTKIKLTTHRTLAILAVIFAVLWLWAELAVGIFTNWGS